MKLIDLTCNKCGAQLKVNAELSKCMCQYCGNEMLIDQEIIHHKIDNAFDAGYQSELGKIKAQEEYKRHQEYVARQKYTKYMQQREMEYQKNYKIFSAMRYIGLVSAVLFIIMYEMTKGSIHYNLNMLSGIGIVISCIISMIGFCYCIR